MAHADPRKDGFNYGAPVAEPVYDATYLFAKRVAAILRRRNSSAAIARSWALDMLIRDVRVSCSVDEQERKLAKLKVAIGSYARYITFNRHTQEFSGAMSDACWNVRHYLAKPRGV